MCDLGFVTVTIAPVDLTNAYKCNCIRSVSPPGVCRTVHVADHAYFDSNGAAIVTVDSCTFSPSRREQYTMKQNCET